MEIWDLYNQRRELVGRDHIRGEVIPEGCYHLVVHAWICNSKGEYLISQRSADRRTFPLMWECVGGSVIKGEDSMRGVLREIREEIGLRLSPECGRLVKSVVREAIDGARHADILDVWEFKYDGPVSLAQATTREVARVCWMTSERIKKLYDEGKLVHTLKYFFDMISQ